MISGTIIKGIGGNYTVKSTDTNQLHLCSIRGRFRKTDLIAMIGDKVEIESVDDKTCSIEKIFPRKNALIRPPVANIDQLLVVVAPINPIPNYNIIDNLLVSALSQGILPMICISKCDLDCGDEIFDVYRKTGFPIFRTDIKTNNGVNELYNSFAGKITALAGNSGVGKSSLINAINDNSVLKTGVLSEKIQRGKHTTRHVELMELKNGGLVLDTPGFNSFEIDNVKPSDLAQYFPEFGKHIASCKFGDCSHIKERDCGVIAALNQGEISKVRYGNYIMLYNQLKKIKSWEMEKSKKG